LTHILKQVLPSGDGEPAALAPSSFAAVCKALGHPARVRIVAHLMEIDRCICGQIVDILPLAQSTVSQHLKQLKEAGLVLGEVEGPRTCYCLNRATWARFKKSVNLLHPSCISSQEEEK